MDKSYPSITLMEFHSLDVEKELFSPRDDGNVILGLNVPECHWIHQTQLVGTQEYLLISPRHQTSCPDFPVFKEILIPISLDTLIRSLLCQIIDKLSIHTRCDSHSMNVFQTDLSGYINQPLSQR